MANRVDDKLQMELTSILLIIMYPLLMSVLKGGCRADFNIGNALITSIRPYVRTDSLLFFNPSERHGRTRASVR